MKLNKFEKLLVKNPIRFWFQNHIESRMIKKYFYHENLATKNALEIGCGFGNGIKIIHKIFNPNNIHAIDFDVTMVTQTLSRNMQQQHLSVSQGDASNLAFGNKTFDKVFNFAVFHHIPNWQQAVKEVYRVLSSGGYFYIEDLYRNAICNPLSKRLFVHPQTNRFDHKELITFLEKTGFKIIKSHNIFNLFGVILVQKP